MTLESDITRAIREAVSEGDDIDPGNDATPYWHQRVTRAQLARVLGKLLAKYAHSAPPSPSRGPAHAAAGGCEEQ